MCNQLDEYRANLDNYLVILIHSELLTDLGSTMQINLYIHKSESPLENCKCDILINIEIQTSSTPGHETRRSRHKQTQ